MGLWSINLSKFSLKDVRSFRAISGNNLACEQMHRFANIESECEMGEATLPHGKFSGIFHKQDWTEEDCSVGEQEEQSALQCADMADKVFKS